MITDYFRDFEKGIGYGIGKGLESTLYDPDFHKEKPDESVYCRGEDRKNQFRNIINTILLSADFGNPAAV